MSVIAEVETVLGVDVSKYQDPARINWSKLVEKHAFVMVRAAYGAAPDKRCVEHVRCARDAGLAIGLYLFFRRSIQAVDQYLAMADAAERVQLGPGDIIPAVDLEDDGSAKLDQSWSEPARMLCDALAGRWTGCLVYCSRRDWIRLGSPDWLQDHYRWVPHWDAAQPRTPGGWPWHMWQHRVRPLPGIYSTEIDHNIARVPLPTIRSDGEVNRITNLAALTAQESYRSVKR